MKESTLFTDRIKNLKNQCKEQGLKEIAAILDTTNTTNRKLITVEALFNSKEKNEAANFLFTIIRDTLKLGKLIVATDCLLQHNDYKIDEQKTIIDSYKLFQKTLYSINHYILTLDNPTYATLKILNIEFAYNLNENNISIEKYLNKYSKSLSVSETIERRDELYGY
ncbi:MAG: hypothetical protein ACK4OM_05300, partial [Alphaproteobacteria bacterium]